MFQKVCLMLLVATGFFMSSAPANAYWVNQNGGYYYHSSTVAEGYFRGYGDFLRSLGVYHVLNAEASLTYQYAYREYLQNRILHAETYFQLKEINRAWVEANRPRRLTAEELRNLARQGLPNRITAEQWDAEASTFRWPFLLRGEAFSDEREVLTRLFVQRFEDPSNAGIESQNFLDLKLAAEDALDKLRDMIREVNADQYISAKKLLKSIAYEARFQPGQ